MSEFLSRLEKLPAHARDQEVERWLGLDDGPVDAAPPAPDCIGYHASGVDAVLELVRAVPMKKDDVFIDLGAGRGKVLALVQRLTPARVRGVELQPALVARATPGVTLECGDVRDAALDDGTVFFLYVPFTGVVLQQVLAKLERVARTRPIVVAALGLTLDGVPWLRARKLDSFWLQILDSA